MAKFKYPETLYVRAVNPGSANEFFLTGDQPGDVTESNIGDLVDKVARYRLVGSGEIHYTAAAYVED